MISIRNLTKRFDGNPVWEDINLDIRDGETTDRLEVMKKHWARNRE